MGYQTTFYISTIPHNDEALEHLKDVSGYGGWDGDIMTAKWYSYVEDIVTASKQYPELIFRVAGEGEEQGDHWIIYAKAGEVETLRGEVVFPKSEIMEKYAQ